MQLGQMANHMAIIMKFLRKMFPVTNIFFSYPANSYNDNDVVILVDIRWNGLHIFYKFCGFVDV